ncbi:MAG: alanine racemase [candidate division Zixibacteria bacterium]|nr:alanine racemase [candidate division Zixibacteria bacterium]
MNDSQMTLPLAWIELDKQALWHNVSFLRSLSAIVTDDSNSSTPLLCAAIKANAYGHGLREITSLLKKQQVEYIAVHSLAEAAEARKAGWTERILCVGYIQRADSEQALGLNVEPTIYNLENLRAWAAAADKQKTTALVHLKIETGANRQGISPDELTAFVQELAGLPQIILRGVSTHFANIEDTTDRGFARLQLKRFRRALAALEQNGLKPELRHCASSAAHLVFPETRFDMIRCGIALYGHWPSKETFLSFQHRYPKLNGAGRLQPVLSLKCRIAQIKTIKKGDAVGYGLTFRAERKLKAAVLPVGYSDGLDRKLSNIGHALIGGQRVRIIGRVTMNNTVVDVTEVRDVHIEQTATLIGVDGDEKIRAEDIASLIGTIQYEVLARLGAHLPRLIV